MSEQTLDPLANEPNRGFTVRAMVTGALLGGLLSVCNVYLGLKIGWGMNMSITAALLAFGLWKGVAAVRGGRGAMGLGENTISQTGASAAASISSAGLVAPIPAWTMLTGEVLPFPWLVAWVLIVSMVGILVGVSVRRQLIEVDELPFPGGLATGQTLQEMYASGAEAVQRVRMLLGGMAAGALSKIVVSVGNLKVVGLPFAIPARGAAGGSYSGLNLTMGFDPGLLMIAVGAIIGPRACFSMLAGGVVAWGVLLPSALDQGWVTGGDPSRPWFTEGVRWLLWPGVAMMVAGSLTSFAFSWRSVLAALRGSGASDGPVEEDPRDVPKKVFILALGVVGAVAVAMQWWLFDIRIWLAVVGIALSFLMAIVAGRVSGETGVTPVGAMGKVTQLTFGILDPSNISSNLMAANVTGGSASQCGDLLHDMKTGSMVGAWPRHQAVSQAVGVTAGAVVGSAAYMVLIPDPASMLMTEEWAAPAVATWKAVAEVFADGIDAMPPGSQVAMLVAAILGVFGAVMERWLPAHVVRWTPSMVAVGLAFTVPMWTSISFALGAVVAMVAERSAPRWSARFLIVLAAGIIAGETLAGVGDALWMMFMG